MSLGKFLSKVQNNFIATVNIHMKEMLYEVRCLKSNEDMILALAGQFSYPTELQSHTVESSQLCDFVAQLVRALHRHRRGHGFESR